MDPHHCRESHRPKSTLASFRPRHDPGVGATPAAIMPKELLPDSRMKRPIGGIYFSPMGWMIPVFCAACGTPFGYVPEDNCRFACWLCNECVETHGAIFSTMLMPDEAFWKEVEQEQLAALGRLLTPEELGQLESMNQQLKEN